MYRMPTVKEDKVLYLSKCCFCVHCVVDTACTCGRQLVQTDECGQFKRVNDVTARVRLLFKHLPNGYGKE